MRLTLMKMDGDGDEANPREVQTRYLCLLNLYGDFESYVEIARLLRPRQFECRFAKLRWAEAPFGILRKTVTLCWNAERTLV